MHIKKVIIKGFKTYAAQLDFETFHSRTNVIGAFTCQSINIFQFNGIFNSLQFGFMFPQLVKMALESQTLLMVNLHSNSF
jgi:hypothetical protein